MNKIKNIAHVTRIRVRCQSLVGFVTVFCLVHIMSHFFQGNFWASDLANRLSKVADVPVASEDGLSRFICIPCKNKLMSGEYFRTTAKATYEKNKDPTLTASGSNSQVQVTNKRTKDSSGPGASPQTRQCRPGAKRLTPEHPGRRLTYPDCDSC